MISESIWLEQVEEGFSAFIKNIVRIPNSAGVLTPVPVLIRKPEESFKINEYPAISLYNVFSREDETRISRDPIIISRDDIAKTIITEDPAKPFVLMYQLDFWAKYRKHMDDMTRLWLFHTGKDMNIPVKDLSGKSRMCYVIRTGGLDRSDILEDKERFFHAILQYRVNVELDEKVRNEKPMITRVSIV